MKKRLIFIFLISSIAFSACAFPPVFIEMTSIRFSLSNEGGVITATGSVSIDVSPVEGHETVPAYAAVPVRIQILHSGYAGNEVIASEDFKVTESGTIDFTREFQADSLAYGDYWLEAIGLDDGGPHYLFSPVEAYEEAAP